MDFIKDWAITISGFIILSSVAEMLLPNKSFKKYAKLVLGLMLIILVMKPILNVSSLDLGQYDFASSPIETAQQGALVKSTFAQKLASDMEATLKAQFGEVSVDVDVGTNADNSFFIQGIEVSGATESSRKEIASELTKDYGCNQVIFK